MVQDMDGWEIAVAICMHTLQIYSEIQKQEILTICDTRKVILLQTSLSVKSGPAANLSLICNQIIAIQ